MFYAISLNISHLAIIYNMPGSNFSIPLTLFIFCWHSGWPQFPYRWPFQHSAILFFNLITSNVFRFLSHRLLHHELDLVPLNRVLPLPTFISNHSILYTNLLAHLWITSTWQFFDLMWTSTPPLFHIFTHYSHLSPPYQTQSLAHNSINSHAKTLNLVLFSLYSRGKF